MKSKLQFVFAIIFIFNFYCCNSPTPEQKEINTKSGTENLSATEIYQRTVNETVTVITKKGLGSGFFIDSNIIVTNYHVIEGADKADILLNNSEKKYAVIGYLAVDKINDLILLQIEYISTSFISMADKMPQPGEKIYAIGSPVGLSKTISDGLISGIRDFQNKKLLQITAPISHGSSGCPIIDERGRLVGVAVSGITDASNIGFCIPVNFIKTLLDFRQGFTSELSSLYSNQSQEITAVENPPINNTPPKKEIVVSKTKSNKEKQSDYDELLLSILFKPANEQSEIIEKCIQMEPNNYKGYRARAFLKYNKLSDYYGALSDINKALQLNSRKDDVFYLSGLIKEMLNDKAGMCADLKKAYELASESTYENAKLTEEIYREKYYKKCQ